MTTLGIDISHWQGTPDIAALKAQGVAFAGIKAWQGSSPDPMFKTNVANCQAAGMPFFAYVWVTPTDHPSSIAEALDFIGDGVVLALDWEQAHVPASVVEAWMEAWEQRSGRLGLCYYGLFPPDTPTDRIARWPRWFPEYAAEPKLPAWDGRTADPDWRTCYMIWQYSDKGTFPGVPGTFDLNQVSPSSTMGAFIGWLAGTRDSAATATEAMLLPHLVRPTGSSEARAQEAVSAPVVAPAPVLAPQPASPPPAEHPALGLGAHGVDVRVLQTLLGVPWLAHTDGFDEATEYLVKGFQASQSLPVDGIVGPATWAALTKKA